MNGDWRVRLKYRSLSDYLGYVQIVRNLLVMSYDATPITTRCKTIAEILRIEIEYNVFFQLIQHLWQEMRQQNVLCVCLYIWESNRQTDRQRQIEENNPLLLISCVSFFFSLIFMYRKINSKISGGRLLLLGGKTLHLKRLKRIIIIMRDSASIWNYIK